MTPEGKVKDDLKAYLKSLGSDCWFYMPVPMGYGKTGVPDFIICYKGFFLAPETKCVKGDRTKAHQYREQVAINMAGGQSGPVRGLHWVEKWVAECDQKHEALREAGLL